MARLRQGRTRAGRADTADALAAAHHLLLSHGWAAEAIRERVPRAEVGIVLNLAQVYPARDDGRDAAAVRFVDGFNNRWFLDPVFRGEYPSDMLEHFAAFAPPVRDGDLRAIAAPIDFLGVNNYSREVVREGDDGQRARHLGNPDGPHTDMGWEVYPDGLYDLLLRLHEDYEPPALYVTENGAAYGDVRGHDGAVRDPERQDYLERHVDAVGRAVGEGVPVRGYFVWSLLDNFEWAHGYSKRFGIVYVDYPTQERVPKGSFHWYRGLIARHREVGPRSPLAAGSA